MTALANTVIAGLMREEIAAHQVGGIIPGDFKIEVAMGCHLGADRIDIIIKDPGAGPVFLPAYLESDEAATCDYEMYQPVFRRVMADLRAIHRKWQRGTVNLADEPDDFFVNNYAGGVSIYHDTWFRLLSEGG